MAAKILFKLHCIVCGSLKSHADYLGRWSDKWQDDNGRWHANQICSNRCLEIIEAQEKNAQAV